MTIYGSGNQTRAFFYIDDLLPPLWKALTDPKCANQICNLGSEKHYTVKELADTFIKIAGCRAIEYLDARHEVDAAWSDVTKAKRELGLEDKTDLEMGLRKMWEHAKVQKRHPVKTFKETEITRGLYSF